MSEVIVPKKRDGAMGGVKRDYQGKEKGKRDGADHHHQHPHNAYTSMFEGFRDELDVHHDRRTKIGKVSRDVTALSKKIIFSLQRVRKLAQPIPERIQAEIDGRLKEIGELLQTIQPDVQGMNRYRYPLICLEEFVEAVTFAHYLRHQTLMTPAEAQAALDALFIPGSGSIQLTVADYVFGVFDLTGEMMRFATAVTALTGSMPTGVITDEKDDAAAASTMADEAKDKDKETETEKKKGPGSGRRTILTDLQDVSSMLQVCPPTGGKYTTYAKKTSIMVEQVHKVERVGYGVTVRGNERPKGWMPDMNEPGGGGGGDDDVMMD